MDVHYTPGNFFDNLMVVLVIYEMKIAESPAYTSLTEALRRSGQSASLFIYDNSSSSQPLALTENWHVTYRHDTRNSGVSKAYNEGFQQAKAKKKKWILLADQDTHFPVEAFDEYGAVAGKYGTGPIVPRLVDDDRVVSPLKFYRGGGHAVKLLATGQQDLSKFFFDNSGVLVGVDQFERAGMYDENLPLDFSDFSFVYRLRRHDEFFYVANFTCRHSLATVSPTMMNEGLARFGGYVKAAAYFREKYRPWDLWLPIRVFFRALKLTLLHRRLQFLVLYFR